MKKMKEDNHVEPDEFADCIETGDFIRTAKGLFELEKYITEHTSDEKMAILMYRLYTLFRLTDHSHYEAMRFVRAQSLICGLSNAAADFNGEVMNLKFIPF